MDEVNIYRHDSDSDSVNSWLSGSETDSASGNEESDDQDRSRSRPGASVDLVRGGRVGDGGDARGRGTGSAVQNFKWKYLVDAETLNPIEWKMEYTQQQGI